jgi:hypothetical protein
MSTLIDIKDYFIMVASNKTFNEWKGNIFLYRENGTIAVDLRFVDDPDSFSQSEHVNPQGGSQIYTSFSQFEIYINLLNNAGEMSVQLEEDGSPGFAKMILRCGRRTGAQTLRLPLGHPIDLNAFKLSKATARKRASRKKSPRAGR